MKTSCVSIWKMVVVGLALGGLVLGRAATVSLQPVADTTLFQVAPGNNLGGASFFNAGTAGNGSRNRALLRFDIGSSIPSGATINSASLSLDVVRQPSSGMVVSFFDLTRVLQSWGEGTQVPVDGNSPGLGAPAVAGETTWNSRFAPGTPWSLPGGRAGVDYAIDVSAVALVQGLGDSVVFESTSQMVADIRSWLNQPAQNFGWMLMSELESSPKTARGFASRESGFGPTLTIDFTPVPEPSAMVLVGISLLAVLWGRVR